MNFVETAPVTTPRIVPEAIEPTPAKSETPCQKTAFGVSFVLTIAVFSFTLLGLITTGNWITDNVVIPKLYGQQGEQLKQPAQQQQQDITDNAATVETTMAK